MSSHRQLKQEHIDPFMQFYQHLPNEFLPPELQNPENSGQAITMDQLLEWRASLRKTFPRTSIPHKLKLKPGFSYQPPRFLFGWAMDDSTLCSIAQACGFAKGGRCDETLVATAKLKRILDERFPEVMQVLGWVIVHPVTTEMDFGKRETFQCIALADSWVSGSRKPSAEHVQVLRDFFGIGKGKNEAVRDEPMWWVDLLNPQWQYRDKEVLLKDYRPWDLKPGAKG